MDTGLALSKRNPTVEKVRIILMAVFCYAVCGELPGTAGNIQMLCTFAAPVLYMISGYYVLRKSEHRPDRILRTIQRTAFCLLALWIGYFVFNFYFVGTQAVLPQIMTRQFWVDLIVLGKWDLPVGSTLCYVQGLLYAYVLLYFLEKAHLLAYNGILAAALLLVAAVCEEFPALFGLHFFGYDFLFGGWLLRALPYILLGSWVHENKKKLWKVENKYYQILCAVGCVMILGEAALLSQMGKLVRRGHFIGTILVSVALFVLIFKSRHNNNSRDFFKIFPYRTANVIYYICPAVSYFLTDRAMTLTEFSQGVAMPMMGILTYLICLTAVLAGNILWTVVLGNGEKKKEK